MASFSPRLDCVPRSTTWPRCVCVAELLIVFCSFVEEEPWAPTSLLESVCVDEFLQPSPPSSKWLECLLELEEFLGEFELELENGLVVEENLVSFGLIVSSQSSPSLVRRGLDGGNGNWRSIATTLLSMFVRLDVLPS